MDSLAAAINAVDAERMMSQLKRLGQWQKYPGTQEERESLGYLESELTSLGFRTQVLEHDAYISTPGAARVSVEGRQFAAITHSFSRASGVEPLRALAVYVGRGMPEDLAGRDLRGRVLIVDGIATPRASVAASDAGAIAQVHVSPHEYLHEMCISPIWGSPSTTTQERLPSTAVCSIRHADGEELKRLLRDGPTTVGVSAEVDTGWCKTPILVADMAPMKESPGQPFVLFSGHHDTWYHGLMDNGSANIAMLEVARICAARTGLWRRALRLCFWSGHSHGRYSGSTWYVDNHWSELRSRCVAHVNIDSPGGLNSTLLEKAQAMGVLLDLADEAIREQSQQHIMGDRMARAGDQSLESLGVPAMFMGVGQQPDEDEERTGPTGPYRINRRVPNALGWWWHTPHDTLDKIDPQLQARDTRIYVHTLVRLLELPVLPLKTERAVASLAAFLQPLMTKLLLLEPGIGALQQMLTRIADLSMQFDRAIVQGVATDPERVNRALLGVCHALIPLEYVSGDMFSHDAALPQPSYPLLQPLVRLVGCEPGSDAAKFQAVEASRARNRAMHALEVTEHCLRDGLASLTTSN